MQQPSVVSLVSLNEASRSSIWTASEPNQSLNTLLRMIMMKFSCVRVCVQKYFFLLYCTNYSSYYKCMSEVSALVLNLIVTPVG